MLLINHALKVSKSYISIKHKQNIFWSESALIGAPARCKLSTWHCISRRQMDTEESRWLAKAQGRSRSLDNVEICHFSCITSWPSSHHYCLTCCLQRQPSNYVLLVRTSDWRSFKMNPIVNWPAVRCLCIVSAQIADSFTLAQCKADLQIS